MKNEYEIIKKDTYRVYEDHAEAYDKQRGKSLFEKKWLERFMKEVTTGKEILDVGCGSAEPIAKFFIENDFTITGIDASSSMIRICQERYPDLSWHQLNMIDFSLNRKFDAIIAWNSFFHLDHDEQLIALRNFTKHLRSGGTLLFTAGHGHGEVLGHVNGEQVYHSSLEFNEYETYLNELGVKIVDHCIEDRECNGHSVFLWKKL